MRLEKDILDNAEGPTAPDEAILCSSDGLILDLSEYALSCFSGAIPPILDCQKVKKR